MQRLYEKRATNPFMVLFFQLCGAYFEVIATIVLANWLKKDKKKRPVQIQTNFSGEQNCGGAKKKNQRPQCFDKCMMSVRTLLRSFTIR